MSKKRELVTVEYRPAKNGIISETRTRTARGGQGGGPDYDLDHETAVHRNAGEAQAHLGRVMGAMPMGGGAVPEEKD